jgi:hypothetical protein
MSLTYPWEAATAAWVGWIPTVSGHLSFSLIGGSGSTDEPPIVNGDKPGLDGRVVLIQRRRRNRDFGYWSWVAANILRDTEQDYVLVAHTEAGARPEWDRQSNQINRIPDARGCLRGTVFWFPFRYDDDLRNDLQSTLSDLNREANRVESLHGDQKENALDAVENWVRTKLSSITEDVEGDDQVAQQVAFKFEFALYRTGEFRLWYERNHVAVDELDGIARQVFYFLKDIAHTHSHHEPESDQIVHLARTKPGKYGTAADCESYWRNETQWGLSRVFEQLHRSTGIGAQRRALGMLAYADAFQGSLAQVMRVPGGNEEFCPDPNVALYDNQHRRESARAMLDYRAFRVGEKGQILLLVVTALLASAGLWYGFTSIRSILCPGAGAGCLPLQAETSARVVSLIINSPMTFFAFCSYSVYTLFNVFIKDWDDVPIIKRPQSGFLRMSFSVLSNFAKKRKNPRFFLIAYVAIFIVLLIAIACIGIYMILINQAEIRQFANGITMNDILQGLP